VKVLLINVRLEEATCLAKSSLQHLFSENEAMSFSVDL
jgi:hypothetical protein